MIHVTIKYTCDLCSEPMIGMDEFKRYTPNPGVDAIVADSVSKMFVVDGWMLCWVCRQEFADLLEQKRKERFPPIK